MSDQPQGPGWWQASDYKWYPPQPPAAPPPPAPPMEGAFGAPPGYAPPQQQPQWGQPQQQPAYAGAPVPPPAPKSGNAGKIILAIAIVFVVLGGGCVALLVSAADEVKENEAKVVTTTTPVDSGGDDPAPADEGDEPADVDDAEEPADTGGGSAGTREAPLAIGTDVDLGNGWTVRVDTADVGPGANDTVAAANQFNDPPDAGFRFIVVTMTASFAGTEDAETESPGFGFTASVFGSANVERNSYDALAVGPDPQFDDMSELAAGGTATGSEVFAVGADETNLVMRIEPAFSFDETETWIALG